MSEKGAAGPTVILHVGMHKTGTTSIQRSLQDLSQSRARYVQLGTSNHSVPIVTAFSVDPTQMGMHKRAGREAGDIAALKEKTLQGLQSELSRGREFDKFVISGEGIVALPPPALRALRSALLAQVPRVQAFAYVREPVGYSVSAFQQRVKSGAAPHRLAQPDYRKKFERFINVFGRENFSTRVFSRERLKDGSVVADFCATWGLPYDAGREVRTNESISEAVVKLLHLFNRAGPGAQTDRRWRHARVDLAAALAEHFPGRFELPARFHGQAVDAADLAWLERELQIAFPVRATETASSEEFSEYLETIDAAVVSAYREVLAKLGIETSRSDTPLQLLERHFQRCLQAVGDGRRPR